MLKLFIEFKVDLEDESSEYGDTFLNQSVYTNRIDLVKLALEAGANPNARNSLNFNSLMIAKLNDYPDMQDLLLQYDAVNENIRYANPNDDLDALLQEALKKVNYKEVKKLLFTGARAHKFDWVSDPQVNKLLSYGKGSLRIRFEPDLKIEEKICLSIVRNRIDLVKEYLEDIKDPNFKLGGKTMLNYVKLSYTDMLNLLKEHNVTRVLKYSGLEIIKFNYDEYYSFNYDDTFY